MEFSRMAPLSTPADGKPEHELHYTPLGFEMLKSHKSANGPNEVAPGDENDPAHLSETPAHRAKRADVLRPIRSRKASKGQPSAERQSRFGAVPADEFFHRVAVRFLGARRS